MCLMAFLFHFFTWVMFAMEMSWVGRVLSCYGASEFMVSFFLTRWWFSLFGLEPLNVDSLNTFLYHLIFAVSIYTGSLHYSLVTNDTLDGLVRTKWNELNLNMD